MADFLLFFIFLSSFVIMMSLGVRLIATRRDAHARQAAMSAGPYVVTNGRIENRPGFVQIHPNYQRDFITANMVAYPANTLNGHTYQTNPNGFHTSSVANGNNIAVDSYQMGTPEVQLNPPTYAQVMAGQHLKPQTANANVTGAF